MDIESNKYKKSFKLKKIIKPKPEEPEMSKEEKLQLLENEGVFEAFEFIVKSYYNGGMKTDINIFDFASNRL